MYATYIKCSKCGDYKPFGSGYAIHLERNLGSNTTRRGKFGTYICEECAQEIIESLDKEDNNGTVEEENNES